MKKPLLNIVLWKWNQPNPMTFYTAEHVNVMCSMLRRNLQGIPHRIICVTDDQSGLTECESFALWPDTGNIANATKKYLPSCYRRLKLYHNETQSDLGIGRDERIMSIDLDTLICGPLKELVETEGKFVGWEMVGTHHPKVFNGSLQMFTAGTMDFIWSSFDPMTSPRKAFEAGWLGSDQSWLSMNLVGKEGSVGVKWPLVASYPLNVRLPARHDHRTRVIFYHGRTKPWSPEARRETELTTRYWR